MSFTFRIRKVNCPHFWPARFVTRDPFRKMVIGIFVGPRKMEADLIGIGGDMKKALR